MGRVAPARPGAVRHRARGHALALQPSRHQHAGPQLLTAMTRQLGFWIAHFNILAVCAVLLGAFEVQFVQHEFPCPLCVLQRMAMLLCALGPAFIILKARNGEVEPSDFATGYGMSVLAALGGAAIAGRQVLLHIVPPDPGFGEPVFGLHLYTWSLIV